MSVKLKLRLLNDPLMLSIIILPFFWPAAVSELFPSLDIVHDILRLCSFACIIILVVIDRKLSKIIVAIFAYEATLLLSTLINGGDYWKLAVECGSVLAVCLLVDLMSVKNASAMIKAFLYLFAVEVIINLITIIAFPGGLYKTNRLWQNWFLGYDNSHFMMILPLLCIFAVYSEKSRISTSIKLFVVLIFSLSVFVTWSGASVVAVTVWIVLWLIAQLNIRPKVNAREVVAAHAGFFFLIVIARMQNLFKWLIVDILDKDLTFSGRTIRWDKALEMFKVKPLLGWGVVDTDLTRSRLAGFSHCHNHFLQILYQSGLLGMVFFLIPILMLERPLKKVKNKNYSFYFLITILCFFIVGQVEAITNMTSLFAIITMAYHAPQIESALESDKRRSRVRFVLKKRWST